MAELLKTCYIRQVDLAKIAKWHKNNGNKYANLSKLMINLAKTAVEDSTDKSPKIVLPEEIATLAIYNNLLPDNQMGFGLKQYKFVYDNFTAIFNSSDGSVTPSNPDDLNPTTLPNGTGKIVKAKDVWPWGYQKEDTEEKYGARTPINTDLSGYGRIGQVYYEAYSYNEILIYNDGSFTCKSSSANYEIAVIDENNNVQYLGMIFQDYIGDKLSEETRKFAINKFENGSWNSNVTIISAEFEVPIGYLCNSYTMSKMPMINFSLDVKTDIWVFGTRDDLVNYLRTGNYTTALNYGVPTQKDYMDLNVPGNSVQTNAVYEFIDPKPGIAYNTPQQIKIDWEVKGAQKNPYITKTTVFDIPANAHCFVMFDGKSLDLYSSLPGVKLTMGVYNNKKLIASLERTEATLVSHINDLFGIEKPEQQPSGSGMVYNVKIYTPYCFLRQIYNCASRDELPGKGEPTYEIFQPNTSSTHVNPNGTGVKATDHFISFNSIADMKDASDRKLITGGNTNGST